MIVVVEKIKTSRRAEEARGWGMGKGVERKAEKCPRRGEAARRLAGRGRAGFCRAK